MANEGIGRRAALAAALACGLGVAWGFGASLVGTAVEDALTTRGPTESLQPQADGSVVIQSYAGGRSPYPTYHDPEGRPVEPPGPQGFQGLDPCYTYPDESSRLVGRDWRERVHVFHDLRRPPAFWYFVHDGRDPGAGYFVGYDSESNARVGYLGRGGYREDVPPAGDQFPCATPGTMAGATLANPQRYRYETTQHPNLYNLPHGGTDGGIPWSDVFVRGSDGKVYRADLTGRTVGLFAEVPDARSIGLVGVTERGRPNSYRKRVAVRGPDAVSVFDAGGQLVARCPIPESFRGVRFNFGVADDGRAMLVDDFNRDVVATERGPAQRARVAWVGPGGDARVTEVLLARQTGSEFASKYMVLPLPSPAALAAVTAITSGDFSHLSNPPLTQREALARAFREAALSLAAALALSAVLAVLTFRREVRYATSGAGRIGWPLFVFVLGLPGWVGYRLSRSWPPLERCPQCGAEVPRDRGECARCAKEFPLPALTGAELFA